MKMVSNVMYEKSTLNCMENIICKNIDYGTHVSGDTGRFYNTWKRNKTKKSMILFMPL